MATKTKKGSNKMPRRETCGYHGSKNFRKGLRIWEFMNPAKKMTPAQKGALAYLGKLLTKENSGE